MSSTYFVRPTIPGRYLVELLAHTGVDTARCLEQAGLPREVANVHVSVEQFEALYRVALRACEDELFGFGHHKAPPGAYAVAVRLASRSRDLADFIESVTRFYAMFDAGHRHFELAQTDSRTTLRFVG